MWWLRLWLWHHSLTHHHPHVVRRLDEVFASLHVVRLAQNDEFVVSLWRRVQPQLQVRSSMLGAAQTNPHVSVVLNQCPRCIIIHRWPCARLASTPCPRLGPVTCPTSTTCCTPLCPACATRPPRLACSSLTISLRRGRCLLEEMTEREGSHAIQPTKL